MFYCPPCRKKNSWPESLARSQGTCEVCGRPAVCYDTPSGALPVPRSKVSPARGLDYETGRRVREFIRANMAEPLTARQIAVRFRLRPDNETDIRDLMIETALIGRPEPAVTAPGVRTSPAEVLDILVAAVAEQSTADYRIATCLRACQFCRNHLLYLLDTAPYADAPRLLARLRALPETHEAHGPAGPDQDPPRIRWISP